MNIELSKYNTLQTRWAFALGFVSCFALAVLFRTYFFQCPEISQNINATPRETEVQIPAVTKPVVSGSDLTAGDSLKILGRKKRNTAVLQPATPADGTKPAPAGDIVPRALEITPNGALNSPLVLGFGVNDSTAFDFTQKILVNVDGETKEFSLKQSGWFYYSGLVNCLDRELLDWKTGISPVKTLAVDIERKTTQKEKKPWVRLGAYFEGAVPGLNRVNSGLVANVTGAGFLDFYAKGAVEYNSGRSGAPFTEFIFYGGLTAKLLEF